MSLDADGAAVASESVASESSSGASESSKGEYSVTDPGHEADIPSEPVVDELQALKDENTPETKPPDVSGDASEADAADAEGDSEETVETPAAEAADPEGISDELLDRANALGYTLDDIKGFPSEKLLAKEVDRVEKLQQRLQERQAGKTPAEESAPVEEAKPEPKWDELIEAGHDPDMIALQKESWQEAQAAKAMVKQMFQAEQDRAWTAQCERFDEGLNKLGDEYKELLGTGRRGELAKSSPEIAKNRDAVFEKMIVLRNGYQQTGRPMPSEADLIQEAVQASFWKQTKTMARKELTSEIKKAGSQALSRPHSSGAKPLSGPPLAAAKEQAFWKKHA